MMVVIHVWQSQQHQFLYQARLEEDVDRLIPPLVRIHNLRLLISRLQCAGQHFELPLTGDGDAGKGKDLVKALAEAGACASERQVVYNVALTPYMLEDAIAAIRVALSKCYPLGLPTNHPLTKELEGASDLQVDSVQLWWAGKQLWRGCRLCDYVGRNDKTRIRVKLV